MVNSDGASASFVNGVHSCQTSGNTGRCSVQVTSPTAGATTVPASADTTVGGVTFHLTTDGTSGNSGPAVKTWVDASIAVSPLQATNVIEHQHVFTISATAIPAGATPVVFNSVTTSVNPTPTSQSNTCDAAHWTVSGNNLTCTLTINNDVEATYTVNAARA